MLELKPDVILLDIQMPGRQGLDILKDIRNKGVNGKFIIISGYSNFDYAKKAIRYGVKDYLLKPIEEEELLEIVLKLKKEIEEEKKSQSYLEQNKTALRQYLLGQLILNKEIKEYEDVNKVLNHKGTVQVALISNSSNQYNFDNILKIEEVLINNLDEKENIDVIKLEDKIALVIRNINSRYANKLLNKIKNKLDQELESNNFIALGEEVSDIEEIYSSYRSAKKLTNHKFLFNTLDVASNSQMDNKNANINLDKKEILNSIYTYLEIGQLESFNEYVSLLKKFIRDNWYKENESKVLITKSLLDFSDKLKKDYSLLFKNKNICEEIIDEIYKRDSLEDVINVLKKGLMEISKEISINSNNSSIKRIVKYVDTNYYKDLKLETLAEIFNYNSAYLGKIFKNYTGVSFNTYLDKRRIDEGKKLLLEKNLKVYEVCELIGYKNIDYFHSKFKKYVGVSPLNYKKQKEVTK
ncbi:response regulator [Clostridium sp.]|uniref:response regulator transcription factor n=1 Tax=Clostridium sp. TaxID=1506 RepID=UPI0029078839|nr:response regulator [Clostridium sp.]MDU5105800.1 response regulator [Clostridium sp.]